MKKYITLFVIIILISIVGIIWVGINLSPGSYPNTEKYEFNIPEEELIKNIDKLRNIDSTLKVPDAYAMIEGRKGNNDHWYHFYIFYSKEQEILNCWVRASSTTSTNLAFVSIRDKYGKWKSLDRDFNASEQKVQKKKFEERFINRLKKITDKNLR